jgi:hypothetical protein
MRQPPTGWWLPHECKPGSSKYFADETLSLNAFASSISRIHAQKKSIVHRKILPT